MINKDRTLYNTIYLKRRQNLFNVTLYSLTWLPHDDCTPFFSFEDSFIEIEQMYNIISNFTQKVDRTFLLSPCDIQIDKQFQMFLEPTPSFAPYSYIIVYSKRVQMLKVEAY